MGELTFIQAKALEITALSLDKISPKGWMYGRCPFCNDPTKFGMKFNHDRSTYKNHLSFNCFRGSCQEKGTEYNLFKHFNLLHLLKERESNVVESPLEAISLENIASVDIEVPEISLPVGWERVYDHPYLRNRGWGDEDFENHCVGITTVISRWKDYLIFPVYEDQIPKGYVMRSVWKDEDREKYNAHVKDHNRTALESDKLTYHFKYLNSSGTFFEKLLYGIDQLPDTVTTAIIVEGIFDFFNVSSQLSLMTSQTIRCLSSFGKKISTAQMIKMKEKGIQNVILLYDPDAIDASKQYLFELTKHFNVRGAIHLQKDPGEMNRKELIEVIENSKTPEIFFATFTGASL